MCRIALAALCALSALCAQCGAEPVPVFAWGDLQHASQRSNPLQRISGVDFEEILRSELTNEPLVVAFIEETLSVEDFSKKNSDGTSSYPYLHANLGESLYLPAVESALKTLNHIADPGRTHRVKLTENGLSAEINHASTSYLFIELEDAREDESRAAMLRRHNDFMEEMFTKLQAQYERIVCVYTAHYPSWVVEEEHEFRSRRHLLQAEIDNATDSKVYNISGELLLYVDRITIQDYSNPPQELTDMTTSSTKNGTELDVVLQTTNYTVEMHFNSRAGYWFLDEVDVTSSNVSEKIASSSVFAIHGFSYHCSHSVTFKGPNGTYALTLTDFQLQPFFTAADGSSEQFGDYFDCTGFTSVAIWSGLFVVFIMLSVFFYGVTMMMDIRTMDRFDDPKGKTITINASE